MPLLAFWASQLPNLESPAASAAAATILELLLASSADPLAVPLLPGRTCLGVHPRHGTIASFLLVCRDPQLLGAAVQHVLRQRAEARGGRPLSHSEAAVLLVAARLAGLAAESQHLLAQQGSDVEAEEEQEGVLRLGSELQAQLMADAAAGGICDMLELFLR